MAGFCRIWVRPQEGEFKVTRHVTSGGSRYVRTFTYGGVDFSRVPFQKVSARSFSDAHAGLPKSVDRSLTRPVAGPEGGTVWLGSLTPKQRTAAAGWEDGSTGKGSAGLFAAGPALRAVAAALVLMLAAVLLLRRRRGRLTGAGGTTQASDGRWWSDTARPVPAPRTTVPAPTRTRETRNRRGPARQRPWPWRIRRATAPAQPQPQAQVEAQAQARSQAHPPAQPRPPAPTPTHQEPATSPPGDSTPTTPAPDPDDPYALHDPAQVTAHLPQIAHHLDRAGLDRSPADVAMLKAVGDAVAAGQAPDEAGRHFLRHHLTMAELMDDGTPPGEALRAALRTHPFAQHYSPEVIDRFPELFNNNWRRARGMRPR